LTGFHHQIARHLSNSSIMSTYTTRKIGQPNTLGKGLRIADGPHAKRVYRAPHLHREGWCPGLSFPRYPSLRQVCCTSPFWPQYETDRWDSEQKTLLNMVVEIPRWTNAKLEVGDANRWQGQSLTDSTDLQGGAPQPHQAGRQEGQAPLRPQLLPPQGLPLELRMLPSGTPIRTPLVRTRTDSPQRLGRTPTPSTPRPRPRVTTTLLMSARSESSSPTPVRSSA
jgi:hypothetical protein